MERVVTLHLILLITPVAMQFIEKFTGKACGLSDDLHVSLTCNSSEWVNVYSEKYSPATVQGGNCSPSGTCSKMATNHVSGLEVSCNGPVGSSGQCEEEMNVREMLKDCGGTNDNAAVEVSYSCVSGEKVMDMCTNQSYTWEPSIPGLPFFAYLATPGFPNTPATSQHCSCQLSANLLYVESIELQLDPNPVWTDILTLSVGNIVMWTTNGKSGHLVHLQKELLTSGNVNSQLTVSYRDYNQPRQLAWLKFKGFRNSLSITCESKTVPPPPPLPSTTTTTTTSITTKAATTTTTTTTTTTSPAPTTPARTTSVTTAAVRPAKTRPPYFIRKTTTKPSIPKNMDSVLKPDKESEDAGVIVGLCILAIILIIVAVVLGIIVYRRFLKARKDGQYQQGRSGSGWRVLGLQYWYRHFRHQGRNHGSSNPEILEDPPINEFHNVTSYNHDQPAAEAGSGYSEGHYETIDDLDLTLRRMPSRGNEERGTSGVKQGEGQQVYDNAGFVPTDKKKSGEVDSKRQSPFSSQDFPRPPSSHASSTCSLEKFGSATSETGAGWNSSGEGEVDDKKARKTEKYVTKVLDQTLDSIISQREALASSPELPDDTNIPAPGEKLTASLPASGGTTGNTSTADEPVYAVVQKKKPPSGQKEATLFIPEMKSANKSPGTGKIRDKSSSPARQRNGGDTGLDNIPGSEKIRPKRSSQSSQKSSGSASSDDKQDQRARSRKQKQSPPSGSIHKERFDGRDSWADSSTRLQDEGDLSIVAGQSDFVAKSSRLESSL